MALSTVHVFIQDRGLLNEFHCICDKELLKQVQSPDFKPFWFLFGKKRTKTVQVCKQFFFEVAKPRLSYTLPVVRYPGIPPNCRVV